MKSLTNQVIHTFTWLGKTCVQTFIWLSRWSSKSFYKARWYNTTQNVYRVLKR